MKENHLTENKPRVLLIPDVISWILGTWAKKLSELHSDKYDFIIFPFNEIGENEKLFLNILPEVDVVHCLTSSSFDYVNDVINRNKIKHATIISSVHHIVDFSHVKNCLNADKIMVVCRKVLKQLIDNNIPEEKVLLISNGVDTDFFLPQSQAGARKKLGLPDGRFIIGFSGKASSDHDGRKGIDIFLDIFSRLSSYFKSKVYFVMTGPGWDELIKENKLKNLTYFPFVERSLMPVFFNALDIYLITSREEGGPAPLLEAMSCGVPVVTTPVGIVEDIVENKVSGMITPIGDAAATCNAIIELYKDSAIAKEMGANGRSSIVKKLQWKDTFKDIDKLYGTKINRCGNNKKISPAYLQKLNKVLIKKDEKRWATQITQNIKHPSFFDKIRSFYSSIANNAFFLRAGK